MTGDLFDLLGSLFRVIKALFFKEQNNGIT